jgi:hypothetical protein
VPDGALATIATPEDAPSTDAPPARTFASAGHVAVIGPFRSSSFAPLAASTRWIAER